MIMVKISGDLRLDRDSNCIVVVLKTFWKIETANAIYWMYLGGTA